MLNLNDDIYEDTRGFINFESIERERSPFLPIPSGNIPPKDNYPSNFNPPDANYPIEVFNPPSFNFPTYLLLIGDLYLDLDGLVGVGFTLE